MLQAVAQALGQLGLEGRPLLVAVSGGVDSMALALALHELAPRLALRLALGHVHHGLRGAAADADQQVVADLAGRLGVPFEARRVDPRRLIAGRPSGARPTLQEAARRLRYDALGAMAEAAGAEAIATAHTLDDQAETVLLRLLRGTGPEGLGGIPERSPDGRVVRPLLRVSRAQVVEYARSRGAAWREDPSNADPRFARSRLRREWLDGLRDAFNPNLLRAIGDLAEAQRRESEWIGILVERESERRFRWLEGEGARALAIEAGGWSSEATPDALARRLAREAMHRMGAGRDVSRAHLDRIVCFLRSARRGGRLELPGGLALVRQAQGFRLAPAGLPASGAC